VLDRFTNDLTLAARRGQLDPLVGRDGELRRLTHILLRRTKNNPVLVGEPGGCGVVGGDGDGGEVGGQGTFMCVSNYALRTCKMQRCKDWNKPTGTSSTGRFCVWVWVGGVRK